MKLERKWKSKGCFLAGLLLLPLLTSCGKKNFEVKKGNYHVILPLADANNQVHKQRVHLSTLANPIEVSGGIGRGLLEPQLTKANTSAGVRYDIDGKKPNSQFVFSADKSLIPTDVTSIELFSIYYHLEQNFLASQAADSELKLDPLKFALRANIQGRRGGKMYDNAFFISGSSSIVVAPYQDGGLPLSINGGVIAHEFFHYVFDRAFLKNLVVVIPDERLPEAASANFIMNPLNQVGQFLRDYFFSQSLTFSHSHSGAAVKPILTEFKQTLTEPQIRENSGAILQGLKMSEKEFNEIPDSEIEYIIYLVRGMNEGLADFWAWLYTENKNSVQLSLPAHGQARNLEPDIKSERAKEPELLTKEEIQVASELFSYRSYNSEQKRTQAKNKTKMSPSVYLANFYELGTQIARTLVNETKIRFNITEQRALTATEKQTVRSELIMALHVLTKKWQEGAFFENNAFTIEPEHFLLAFMASRQEELSPESQNFLLSVMEKNKQKRLIFSEQDKADTEVAKAETNKQDNDRDKKEDGIGEVTMSTRGQADSEIESASSRAENSSHNKGVQKSEDFKSKENSDHEAEGEHLEEGALENGPYSENTNSANKNQAQRRTIMKLGSPKLMVRWANKVVSAFSNQGSFLC